MKPSRPKRRRQADRVEETMATEYDFSKAVRGATAKRYAAGSHIVVLDPDVAAAFPDATIVNEALRMLARLAETMSAQRIPRSRRRPRKR